jgi:hypothetical protein
MVVQTMLEMLRDAFDAFAGTFFIGTALILNPNTSVTVNHSYGKSTYQLAVTPTSDPGVGVRWWISSKAATNFVISCSPSPTVGLSFDWILKGVV